MTNPAEILPGVIFYSYYSTSRKEKVGFLKHNTLVLQVAGHFTLETDAQKISMSGGQMLLIGKNQLGTLTKNVLVGEDFYETIVISLQEDLLRKIALEERIEVRQKYTGPLNVLIPPSSYLQGYFQSVIPYVRDRAENITPGMGLLKVQEAVKLILQAKPELKDLLFDFSQPYKVDLEEFMLTNFHYNLTIEKFAGLTGRSLAGFKRDFQKTFGMPPRHWLLEKRLMEAKKLIERKNKKPSDIYLDLGFESLSHFSYSFKKKFGLAPTEFAQ
ncbi:MAG: helix-turn-helix domain-containing protein [Agriterribacter sp.]